MIYKFEKLLHYIHEQLTNWRKQHTKLRNIIT